MKGYESMSSTFSRIGDKPMSDIDIQIMSAETAGKEAISKAIEAITLLTTRVMTVDSCIDIMRRRVPFSKLDRAMDNMQRLCTELTAECMQVLEFCIADNVIAIQNNDKDEDPQEAIRSCVDIAADPPQEYR